MQKKDRIKKGDINPEHTFFPTTDTIDDFAKDSIAKRISNLIKEGYEQRKIHAQTVTPINTIQKRVTEMFENQYFKTTTELDYNKLSLRKGYLHINLKGVSTHAIALKLSMIPSITSILEVMGNYDIMCVFLFRDSADLLNLMDLIKTIEGVEKIDWAEEVHQLEQKNKGLFDGLWDYSLQSLKSSRYNTFDNQSRSKTMIFVNAKDATKSVIKFLDSIETYYLTCTAVGGFKILFEYEPLKRALMSLASRFKNSKIDGHVYFTTHIDNDKDSIKYIRKFTSLGFEVRHIDPHIPMSFSVSDKHLCGTLEQMQNGKLFESAIFSSEPLHHKHFLSIQQELWEKGIDSEERIKQLEKS